ncbi:MAG TPA: biopolymer transporter ExbD [Pirellulales bacterium]|nr:biopolymer transporter ExbD [Pirellulales bacterium]
MAVKLNRGFAYGNINMTPMIDCVFLLLIFFLVATKFEEEEREMNIVLPQASEAVPLTAKPKEVIVNVDHEGKFFVAGKQINEPQLLGALRQAAANNPGRQSVIIRADRRVPFEYVVVVMNCCNQAHIRDYQVNLKSEG